MKFQFSLKHLFVAMTSIAAGCGILLFVLTRKARPMANPYEWREAPRFDVLGTTLWFLSGALIVGAVFSFTKRPWAGALVGALLGALIMFVLKMKG